MEVRRAQAAALTHDRANCKVSPRASKRHLGRIWAVLTAAEGPWHRALAPRSGGNKSVSRLIGSALERTNVLGVPAHGEVSLIRGRGMDARVELFRAPLGPRCGCRILAYGRRGCESGRRVAAIEHHARVVRRCPASVHRVRHVVGHRKSSPRSPSDQAAESFVTETPVMVLPRVRPVKDMLRERRAI